MANMNLQIPDAQVQRVINALCARLMVDAETPVPPTAALAKSVVVDWIKEQVLTYETRLAQEALAAVDVTNIVS